MNINVSKKAGKLFDLFSSLSIACNLEYYYGEIEKVNISIDQQFKELMNKVVSLLGDDISKYRPYFNELNIASSLIDLEKIWELENLDEYLSYVETKEDYDIQKYILTLIDCYKSDWIYAKDEEIYKQILSDNNLLLDFLRNKPIHNEDKWNSMEIINDVKGFKKNFIYLIKKYEKKYNDFIKEFKNEMETYSNYLERKIMEKGTDIEVPIMQMVDPKVVDTLYIIPTYFNAYTVSQTIIKSKRSSYIIIGKYVDKIFEASSRESSLEKYVSIFKNLGDLNRYKFIKILSEGEKYGQEIADELNITSATVNYHANTLLISNLLSMERYENKTYYTLRKDTIRELIGFLQKDLEL